MSHHCGCANTTQPKRCGSGFGKYFPSVKGVVERSAFFSCILKLNKTMNCTERLTIGYPGFVTAVIN